MRAGVGRRPVERMAAEVGVAQAIRPRRIQVRTLGSRPVLVVDHGPVRVDRRPLPRAAVHDAGVPAGDGARLEPPHHRVVCMVIPSLRAARAVRSRGAAARRANRSWWRPWASRPLAASRPSG